MKKILPFRFSPPVRHILIECLYLLLWTVFACDFCGGVFFCKGCGPGVKRLEQEICTNDGVCASPPFPPIHRVQVFPPLMEVEAFQFLFRGGFKQPQHKGTNERVFRWR